MRQNVLMVLASGFVSLVLAGVAIRPVVFAQESEKAAAKSEKGDDDKKAKSGDRLPPNYGKLGVSDEQRKKIYQIQQSYDGQIAELQKQVAALRAKEVAEVEAVLNADQKKALQAANEESKKKTAEKKKAAEKEKEVDKVKPSGKTEKSEK